MKHFTKYDRKRKVGTQVFYKTIKYILNHQKFYYSVQSVGKLVNTASVTSLDSLRSNFQRYYFEINTIYFFTEFPSRRWMAREDGQFQRQGKMSSGKKAFRTTFNNVLRRFTLNTFKIIQNNYKVHI